LRVGLTVLVGTHTGRNQSFDESRMEIVLVTTKVVTRESWYVSKASVQQKVDNFCSLGILMLLNPSRNT
jgi:hypothetical protein